MTAWRLAAFPGLPGSCFSKSNKTRSNSRWRQHWGAACGNPRTSRTGNGCRRVGDRSDGQRWWSREHRRGRRRPRAVWDPRSRAEVSSRCCPLPDEPPRCPRYPGCLSAARLCRSGSPCWLRSAPRSELTRPFGWSRSGCRRSRMTAGRCCVHLRALWWYKWIKLGNTRTRIKLLLYTAAVSSLRLPSSSNAYWSSLCGDPGKLLCSPPQPIILSGYYHTPETKGKHSSNLGRNHHLLFLGILSKHFLLSSYTVRKRNPTLLSLFQECGGNQCQRPMAVSGYNNCLFRSTHKTYGRVLQEGNVVWRDVFVVSLQRLCSLSPCYCLSALKWLLYSQNSVAMDVKAAALWFWVLLFRQKTLALLQSPFPTAFQR